MTRVCFLTNHGVAADPMFEWLPRAITQSPDIFVHMGESVRAKYFAERGRGERPDPVLFESYLKDVGGSHLIAVEAYSYRAFRLGPIKFRDKATLVINLQRNPLIWLESYRSWRVMNMNLPRGNTTALDHEWSVTNHRELHENGFTYSRSDATYWTFLRGIQILNLQVSDAFLACATFCIEQIYDEYEIFSNFIDLLSSNTIKIAKQQYNNSKKFQYNRTSNSQALNSCESIEARFNERELLALEKYWSTDSRKMFASFGYHFNVGSR